MLQILVLNFGNFASHKSHFKNMQKEKMPIIHVTISIRYLKV